MSEESAITVKPFTRSQAKKYSKDKDCVLCVTYMDEELIPVRTEVMHEVMYGFAMRDYELLIRLQHSFDGVAGDIKYHKSCRTRSNTNLHILTCTHVRLYQNFI